ncbi:MAG: 7-carboxy-7-deazaguanine synthase QueE [Bacteroidetes bacterium]|nr:MAG: 7-carboxy-7-deazaguanine synthase QueE [Bacteroidota bacterium]
MSLEKKYPIMEVFPSLQGEGRYSGVQAYFIRLAGCDVGCVWCDVKESWNAGDYKEVTVRDIVGGAIDSKIAMVVITGGEPCMYDLNPLTEELKSAGLRVHLETSGAYPIRGEFDWITLSPKKFKACLYESYGRADELKVVVANKHDLTWSQEQAEQVEESTLLYLQPEWSKKEKVTEMMLDFLKTEQGAVWSLSIQTHKYLGIR